MADSVGGVTGDFDGRDRLVATLRAAGCVFAEDEARLLREAAPDAAGLAEFVARRCAGEPLEHVVGWAAFDGLRLVVVPGTFVPRPRTEFLARTAAALTPPGGRVLDLCCGVGAVAAAVARRVPDARIAAADVSPEAVACARRNLPGALVLVADVATALPADLAGPADVVVANVPYVPTADLDTIPTGEPASTLDGGPDGLAVARQVLARAREVLVPGGYVLIEAARHQLGAASAAYVEYGFSARVESDGDGWAHIVVGR